MSVRTDTPYVLPRLLLNSGCMLTPRLVKAFEVLLAEMQREYNPQPEKKKASWFSWGK